MSDSSEKPSLCGLWVDPEGAMHLAEAHGEEPRRTRTVSFEPFLWSRADVLEAADGEASLPPAQVEALEGEGSFCQRLRFSSAPDYLEALKALSRGGVVAIKPLEQQYLLETRERLFGGLRFDQVRRLQLDIETACSVPGGFSSPRRKEDRVLAIGLRMGGENSYLELAEMTDKAERELLKSLNDALEQMDPDVIEGHNIFKFDLDYLRQRCRRFKLAPRWGRFGQEAVWRNSRIRIAERWVDFPRCDLPGRTVFDTYLMIQIYDVTTRDLASYSLKEVALHLGISKREERTYLKAHDIQQAFVDDRESFLKYLGDDLRETEGVAALLLPTYVAQIKSFPITLQETCLRGTGGKVDLLFLEKYYHANQALPEPPAVDRFEGAYSRSFVTGVFQHVLHYDVASLYPSLLLHIGRNPAGDSLGIFIPMLKELREERLRYKALAREAESEELRREYQARQASYKILINSFYGYLGFGGARFADSELAAEVTRRGRELLVKLIEAFEKEGCTVLEADTDGIYVSSEKDFSAPEKLLTRVAGDLPVGIDLEYDGSYTSMLCYKAKNYALYDGETLRIRGSALRSRGIEPYLKKLSDQLIRYLLGMDETSPQELAAAYRESITNGTMPVEELAKREYLSMNPEVYKKSVETSKKPRRASLEVALSMDPQPRMGEQVAYFLTYGDKKRAPDWQTARPLDAFDPESCPYNADAYLKKIADWEKRYADFLPAASEQTELL